VQPSLRKARPIGRDLRPDAPLAYDRLSDPILVRRAKDGDRLALAALCERHAPRVERIAHHLLRDREDARDAAQDALARLCVKLPQFRGESAFSTWLHRLTVNACRDVAQRQLARRCEPLEEDRRVSGELGPAGQVEAAELRAELGACLAGIAPAQAKVVVLKDAFDFSFEEIAGAEGMPVGTAKCYAHRARNGLRDRLGERLPA
jgi:RNA polymerase sigma-70 factor (ECF subfamily)